MRNSREVITLNHGQILPKPPEGVPREIMRLGGILEMRYQEEPESDTVNPEPGVRGLVRRGGAQDPGLRRLIRAAPVHRPLNRLLWGLFPRGAEIRP